LEVLILRMPQGGSTEGIDLPLGQMGANSFRKEICLYCENLILRKSELPEISSLIVAGLLKPTTNLHLFVPKHLAFQRVIINI